MREKAKIEKCFEEVAAFESCCKKDSLLMVITCRKQNDALKTCLGRWYQDEAFKSECTDIYLKERSIFRSTGMQKKHRDYLAKQKEAGLG
jgi:COX assembly mitochondrial protein 1